MSRLRTLSSLAALLLGPAAVAQQFTYSSTALPANSAWTDGIAIADVDGDGDKDILCANAGGTTLSSYGQGIPAAQHLWLNDGSASFSAGHAQLNLANLAARMVIAEDIDNDGDLDILYARDSGLPNPSAPPVVLVNNGFGIFSDQTGNAIPAGFNQTGFGICAGDTDNDGDLDLIVTNGGSFGGSPTQARLLLNDGTGVFTNGTALHLPVDLFNANDVTLADVDNDFDIDVCLSGKNGGSPHAHLYLNDGAGDFTLSTALDAIGTGGTYETDYGDLDGDSDFDMVVQSISSSNEGWARNDGPLTPWVKTTITGPNQDDNELGLLDFDNDGDLDLFVGSLGSSERCYTNTAASFAITAGVIQAIGDSTLDFGIGDLNGDDRYDLVTGQGESGNFTDKVYLNNGPADTLPPVFKLVETPAGIGGTDTVFRCRVADAISEDGKVNVHVDFSWTSDVGNGSGAAHPQGGGQFRAAVPSLGATNISLTWTATDDAGNVSVNGPIVVGPAGNPWTDLGRALPGVGGSPLLVGTGTLQVGSAGALTLSNAALSAPCVLFLSLISTPVPFKGGSLCAFPQLVTIPLVTSGLGTVSLPWASWPSGASGASLFFQYAIGDGAAIHGVSLSNCVQGDVP